MKSLKVVTLFLTCAFWLSFFSATNIYANIHMVNTKINEEIELQLRQEINVIKDKLFEGIKNKDYDKVSKLLSPKLLELKNFDIKSFINQIFQLITQNEFLICDQYYSTIKKIGDESKATVIPSLSVKNKLIINNLTFYGNESYNLFLKSTKPGWQYLFYLSLSKFDDDWKINIMHVGNYSISYLTAPKLYEIGKEARRKGRLTSCVVYSWAINNFLRPAPYLQYIDEKKYIEFMKSSYSDFNKKITFPFMIGDKKIVGLQIQTTDKEGLIPTILYLTDKNLNNPAVDAEAKQLKEEILKKFYGIDHDFAYMLLRAYNEMPSDPNKKYNVRGTVIKLKDEK